MSGLNYSFLPCSFSFGWTSFFLSIIFSTSYNSHATHTRIVVAFCLLIAIVLLIVEAHFVLFLFLVAMDMHILPEKLIMTNILTQ